jgi:PAP2 superfamily.
MKESFGVLWTVSLSVAAIILTVAGLLVWDQPVLEVVKTGIASGWTEVARFISRYGDFPFLLAAGVVALALSLRLRTVSSSRILTAMILAGIMAGLASNLLKLGAGRVRPRVEQVEHGWYGPKHEDRWVSLQHNFQSFPSSHASCAFGFFFPLFLSRRWAGAAGLLVAAAIAWSRVQLNAHHVSDVAAGALLGILTGWLVWRWVVARGGLSRWLGKP